MTPSEAEHRALQILAEHMPGEGPRVGNGDGPGVDFVGDHLVVSVKTLGVTRIDDLIGRLATGVLQLRARRMPGKHGMVMIGVDRLGARSLAAVEAFMDRHAPDTGWGVFDARGGVRLLVPALGVDLYKRRTAARGRRKSPQGTVPGRTFTDLNRWLWKILLLSASPPASFPRGARGRPHNARELAGLARVSSEKAYQFVRDMERRRYLVQDDDGFRVLDAPVLLSDWVREDAATPAARIPVRTLARRRDGAPLPLDDILEPAIGRLDIAIGGFEACSRLGLQVADYLRPEVHLRGDVEEAERLLDVEVCELRDADFHIVRSRHPESIFRGVQVLDRVPIVDALQAGLDVAGSPARGLEQAEYIAQRVAHWAGA